jgi:WD40 repeat protein
MGSSDRFRAAVLCCLLAVAVDTTPAADVEQLTHDGRQKFSPVVGPGGQEILFAELVNPTLYQLRRLSLKSGASEPLHPKAATSEFEPAWSAGGECYAFLKTRGALSVSVVVCDSQKNVLGEILPADGFCGYRSPALAPLGSLVAFSYAEKGTQQIYSARHNNADRRSLTHSAGINNWPSYASDGRSIVFGSSRDGNFEIYRMNADGSGQQRLTNSPFQDIRPRFSPDAQEIAFTSHRDGNAEIYVMRSDGTRLRRVTDNPERDDYPDWCPDGRRLVAVSERQGKTDLYFLGVPR